MARTTVKIDEYDTGRACKLYTCFLNDDINSEFDKFFTAIDSNSDYKIEFDKLLTVLNDGILENNGAKERYFRPEGRMSDRVFALPILASKLRLYCIRISDEILIIGNGGVKTTKKYQEDAHLKKCVETLQKIDAELKKLEESNKISYLKKTILDFPLFMTINT